VEVVVTAPLLVFLLWRQRRRNTMGAMLYSYVMLLFAFFYVSRFLNENYLGYLAALLTLAWVVDGPEEATQNRETAQSVGTMNESLPLEEFKNLTRSF
jgi:hypothetical protein